MIKISITDRHLEYKAIRIISVSKKIQKIKKTKLTGLGEHSMYMITYRKEKVYIFLEISFIIFNVATKII